VSTGIDRELKAAFETASEFVQPPPDLAKRARTASRARRRRLAATIAAVTASALVAVGGTYLLAKPRQPPSRANHDRPGPLITVPANYQVQQVAVSGQYLYVLTVVEDSPYALSAYDRLTGRLMRRVSIPADPSAMAIGPGGLVWLAFYPDQSGGPTAIWLLRPDLRLHSAIGGIQTSTILPIGRTTALIPDQNGLVRVHMPAPGQTGLATARLEPGTSLGPRPGPAPGVWAGLLDGRVVAQVTNGYGLDSHLVIAGQPGRRFGGTPQRQVGAVASTGSSLWVQLFAVKDNNAASSGPLVRLDGQLRETTPKFVKGSSVLTRSESVWSEGSTIWVASAARGHSLVCFAARSPNGPVTTLPLSGQVAALAATPGTVYVTSTPPHTYDSFTVTSYPVPVACR
jgi:hypothetical protein